MEEVTREMADLLAKGRYFLSHKEFDQAKTYLEKCIKLFHNHELASGMISMTASANLLLGLIYQEQKQWEKAYFHLKHATKFEPRRADSWLFLAQVSLYLACKLGHTYLWNQAYQNLKKALQLDDTLRPAVQRLMTHYGFKKEAF